MGIAPVITALYAAVAGTTTRIALLVRIGTTTIPTRATTILACGWSRAPRAHTNGVNSPYRVR